VPVHQEPSKGANAASARATPELVVTPPDILDLVPALPPELRLLTGLLTAAVIIAGLYFGRDIVVPLALALLLAFVLEPLVGGLRRLGLARAPAVIVVVLTTMMLVGFAGVMLGMQVSSLSAQLPTYQNNIEQKLKGLRNS
jgi:predicted PurR-regulated permease PerM